MHPFQWLTKGLDALSATDPAIRAPLAVSLGAIPGALSRYYLTMGFNQWLGPSFPYGTFFINLSGALIMGFFTTLALERGGTSAELRLLISVGFLGSYTTFSTYALETTNLLKTSGLVSALYWAGSAFLGVVSLEVGRFLARRIG